MRYLNSLRLRHRFNAKIVLGLFVGGLLTTALGASGLAADFVPPASDRVVLTGTWRFLSLDARRAANAGVSVHVVQSVADAADRSAPQPAAWQLQLGNVHPDHAVRLNFGPPGGVPVSGDFNGDGFDEVGAFLDGRWYLDFNGNGSWDRGDLYVEFGNSGDQPVVGDWNGNAKAELGVYTPATAAGEIAVVGDWLGNGRSNVGLFYNGTWLLDLNGDRLFNEADAQLTLGLPGDRPIVGDFNRDGTDEPGFYRDGVWYRGVSGDPRSDATTAVLELGNAETHPIVGDWDGDGRDQIGVMQR